tara:strand:- start:1975 stop:2106 length:132 start_codon:yes stop_codon:yes gene_type:complete
MKEKLSRRRATLKKKRETVTKPAPKKRVAHWFDYYKLNYNSFI